MSDEPVMTWRTSMRRGMPLTRRWGASGRLARAMRVTLEDWQRMHYERGWRLVHRVRAK